MSDLLNLQKPWEGIVPLAVWLLLEPVMTALWCTPGQYLTRTRVRSYPNLERARLLRVTWRWLLRIVFGYDCMTHAPRDPERRGAHDRWSGTVVVYAEKPVHGF